MSADVINTIVISLGTLISALGGYKFVKWLFPPKAKVRREEVEDGASLYSTYKREMQSFLDTTAQLRSELTELMRKDSQREKELIELRTQVDSKTQRIFSLSMITRETADKIEEQAKEIQYFKDMRCEREDCETRIPSKVKRQRATA